MPLYQNSPFQVPVLVTKGVPAYLFGTFDFKAGNTRLYVTSVAIATNVATVILGYLNGPAPVVGGLISIVNTTTGAGEFNVNRAVITAVTASGTNQYTVTFALTGSNVGPVADAGSVICEPPEIPDTLTTSTFSMAALIQAPEGDSQFTVPVTVTFPTMPTAATVTLQRAVTGRDNLEWTNTSAAVIVASSAYTAGPVVEATLERGYLYRFAVTGVTGSGTILAKIGG